MDYKIKIEKFAGPLDLLLQLIEKEQLQITEVAIGQVTDQYVEHLEQLQDRDPEELSDFLVLAVRLLYMKSKALLPEDEPEESLDDLEKQLRMYKEFLEASKKIDAMLKAENFTYSRQKVVTEWRAEFSPAENVTKENLRESFLVVLKRLDPLVKMPRKLLEKTVSLQQKIFHLKEIFKNRKSVSFKELFDAAQSRTEVIVSFLAMLELVKQKHLTVNQNSLFEDITIEKL